MRAALLLTLAACGIGLMPAPTFAQEPSATLDGHAGAALVTTHAILEASLQRIAHRSARWREDVDAVQRLGRQVFVLTPEQVTLADTPEGEGAGTFDPDVVAAAAPVPDSRSGVQRVLVVINVDLLELAHRQRGSLQGEFEADLDALLVHEVYGHAIPYLLAGDLSGRCADPIPGQRADEACSIRRENAVRKDLGLLKRTGYGLDALLVARGR